MCEPKYVGRKKRENENKTHTKNRDQEKETIQRKIYAFVAATDAAAAAII